ncbi:MAG TPA: OmpA family protein [Spirochaetota bacterium]|nr:OmpA family protein [Spirochaetota bacterium]
MKFNNFITSTIVPLYIVAIILFFAQNIFAVTLKWDIQPGSKLEFVYDANVEYYENGMLRKAYSERNIIDLLCYNKETKGQFVKGTFSVYRKNINDYLYRLEEQYSSDFFIRVNGMYDVPEGKFMPNLRHLPSFPEGDVKEGSVWQAPVTIIFNNFSVPLILLLEAQYIVLYINNESHEAIINYSILIDKTLKDKPYRDDMPIKIYGQYAGQVTWDFMQNQPKKSVNAYNLLLLFGRTGELNTIEFKMAIDQTNMAYKHIPDNEKKKQQKEIEKELKQDGVSVDSDTRGMIIRFSDILFEFDKYNLNSEALKVLEKLVTIIKAKYPNNEVLVEGFTDNVGSEDYNMILSEKRAQTVATYLKNSLGHDKISYRGLGKNNPIADNTTAEGRQKNRRVEIIIKM